MQFKAITDESLRTELPVSGKYRGRLWSQTSNRWAVCVIFFKKIANLTLFRSNFAHFWSHSKKEPYIAWLFELAEELNCSGPLTSHLLTGQVQSTF